MLNRSASLAMSTRVLKALPGKLDIKRHSTSNLYVSIPEPWFPLYLENIMLSSCLLYYTYILSEHWTLTYQTYGFN